MQEDASSLGKGPGVSRRRFLQAAAAGAAGLGALPAAARAAGAAPDPALAREIARLEYLTRDEDFTNYGRGKPPPYKLPLEKRREVGLVPETWNLEVVPDLETGAKVDRPLSKELGTALDYKGLMKLAEKRAVRLLAVMTCTNGNAPCGMGLWEGVPLRDVVWMARPSGNVRRLYYHGYHNDDPAQKFQSSLPIGRVLEDPPGEHPVLLCYKLNGKRLSPVRGAPVRMLVPGEYGNKSVKWLQRIVLTNNPQANDTYATWNNDTVSPLKTYARFIHAPGRTRAGKPLPLTGVAQVGISGLSKVQYWIHPRGAPWPQDDPYFTKADWRDADVLPPPKRWGGGLPGGKLPPIPRQLDPATGRPRTWPLRHTIVHWAALVKAPPAGMYDLRCRTVDASGIAQPMPRPFPRSGRNGIQRVKLVVEA